MAAYSYRKYLDLKAKPKPTMNFDDFIDLGARLELYDDGAVVVVFEDGMCVRKTWRQRHDQHDKVKS